MKPLAEQTLYEILDVPSDASAEQIELAFEKAMQFYGPDSLATYTLAEGTETTELLERLEEAYLTLSDPELRQAYDVDHGVDAASSKSERSNAQPAPENQLSFAPILEAVRHYPWPGSRPEVEDSEPLARAVEVQPLAQADAGGLLQHAAEASIPASSRAEVGESDSSVPEAQPGSDLSGTSSDAGNALVEAVCEQASSAAPVPQPIEGASTAEASVAEPEAAPGELSEPPASTAAASAMNSEQVENLDEQVSPVPTPSTLSESPAPAVEWAPAKAAEEPKAPPRPTPTPRMPDLPPNAVFNGELLRRVREGRGLSVRELGERTKISINHLENIEADRYDALPVPVYLRGFLMLIARELKLDPLKVSKSFLEQVARHTGKKTG